MFENLRQDIRQARKVLFLNHNWFSRNVKVFLSLSTFPVIVYRFEHWARSVRVPLVRQGLVLFGWFARLWITILTGAQISAKANIAPGFAIHLPRGVFIGATNIGANFIANAGVLVHYEVRRVGDNVWLGPGVKVIGDTVIGSNVTVVANSLVMSDVPDNSTVVGVPARIRLPRVSLPRALKGRVREPKRPQQNLISERP